MKRTTLSPQEATLQRIFRLIVAGGRTFEDYPFLFKWLDTYLAVTLAEGFTIEIVHGNCRRWDPENRIELPTADQGAREYAYARGYTQKPFNAKWVKYGKRAGPMLNAEMADYGHALVAFWNKKSPGTKI